MEKIRIRHPGFGMEKTRIWDKYSGSPTLLPALLLVLAFLMLPAVLLLLTFLLLLAIPLLLAFLLLLTSRSCWFSCCLSAWRRMCGCIPTCLQVFKHRQWCKGYNIQRTRTGIDWIRKTIGLTNTCFGFKDSVYRPIGYSTETKPSVGHYPEVLPCWY